MRCAKSLETRFYQQIKKTFIKAVKNYLLNQIGNAIISIFCSKELFDKEKPNL